MRVLSIAAAVLAVFIMVVPALADAETLAEIQRREYLEVCANPDALPCSSEKSNPPGFQIELTHTIANDLGVRLTTDWIVYTSAASRTNCDMLPGVVIKDDGTSPRGVRVSIPYMSSG